jgi:hypothetical protein
VLYSCYDTCRLQGRLVTKSDILISGCVFHRGWWFKLFLGPSNCVESITKRPPPLFFAGGGTCIWPHCILFLFLTLCLEFFFLVWVCLLVFFHVVLHVIFSNVSNVIFFLWFSIQNLFVWFLIPSLLVLSRFLKYPSFY